MTSVLISKIAKRHSRLARPAQPSSRNHKIKPQHWAVPQKRLPAAKSGGLALALPLHHVEAGQGIPQRDLTGTS